MDKTVRVGAVQAEPVWLDLNGSVDKTIALIEQAASDGVQVLGFPEVWIPGYPWYVPSRFVAALGLTNNALGQIQADVDLASNQQRWLGA